MSNTNTRLETIVLELFNKKTGNFVKIRCFLDRGSNRTFATKECAEKCGFQTASETSLYVSTFGSPARKIDLKTARVDLYKNTKTLNDPLSVNIFVMDDLKINVTSYELSERQKCFVEQNDIKLADHRAAKTGQLKVDMLLGQDCAHSIAKGESLFLPGGSILVPTWDGRHILAGPLDSDFPTNLKNQKEQISAPHFLAVKASPFFGNDQTPRYLENLIHHVFSCAASEEELEIIESFRDLVILGITPSDYEISPILDDFNKTTTYDGQGRAQPVHGVGRITR